MMVMEIIRRDSHSTIHLIVILVKSSSEPSALWIVTQEEITSMFRQRIKMIAPNNFVLIYT